MLQLYKNGNIGIQGNIGKDGIQGNIGPDGIQGNIGLDGILGIQGNIGPDGILGNQGDQGSNGENGKRNLGNIGKIGKSGQIGKSGNMGPMGSIGDIGLDGITGNLGKVGTSRELLSINFYGLDTRTNKNSPQCFYYPKETILFPNSVNNYYITQFNDTFFLQDIGKYQVFFSLYIIGYSRISIILNDNELIKSICGTNSDNTTKVIQNCIINVTKQNTIIKIINAADKNDSKLSSKSPKIFKISNSLDGEKNINMNLIIKRLT